MGDFTVCISADDVELDVTFHVVRNFVFNCARK